jgi:hypothetical protein
VLSGELSAFALSAPGQLGTGCTAAESGGANCPPGAATVELLDSAGTEVGKARLSNGYYEMDDLGSQCATAAAGCTLEAVATQDGKTVVGDRAPVSLGGTGPVVVDLQWGRLRSQLAIAGTVEGPAGASSTTTPPTRLAA